MTEKKSVSSRLSMLIVIKSIFFVWPSPNKLAHFKCRKCDTLRFPTQSGLIDFWVIVNTLKNKWWNKFTINHFIKMAWKKWHLCWSKSVCMHARFGCGDKAAAEMIVRHFFSRPLSNIRNEILAQFSFCRNNLFRFHYFDWKFMSNK